MKNTKSSPPAEASHSEKRRAPRYAVNHEFRSFEEFLREYALNVSRDGAFIRTGDVLPVGTPVRLRFTLIVDDVETIEGMGEVVRAVDIGGQESPGIGVVFTRLTPQSQSALGRLLTRHSGRERSVTDRIRVRQRPPR